MWVVLSVTAVAVILAAIIIYRRRRRTGVDDLLRAVAVESMHDILLPDEMGGQIHLEHVLLTAKGLLVLDVKSVKGMVFAGDRLDEWTVIGNAQRFTFQNPQRALYDRVVALKAKTRDVPVVGYVLFLSEATFNECRPADVILPDELRTRFAKPEKAELERLVEAFYPHWEKVKAGSEPALRSSSSI